MSPRRDLLLRSALLTAPAALVANPSGAALAMPRTGAWAPAQPVRLIIPAAPGGSLDILGRLLARRSLASSASR